MAELSDEEDINAVDEEEEEDIDYDWEEEEPIDDPDQVAFVDDEGLLAM